MRRAKCFGINLARLDIERSSRHNQLINELFKKFNKEYSTLTENEKLKFFQNSLNSNKNIINNYKFINKENKEFGQLLKYYPRNHQNV